MGVKPSKIAISTPPEERVRAYHQKLAAYYQLKIADLEREGDNP
jgi:hypothetical protein